MKWSERVAATHLIIAGPLWYFGGAALHLWTAYLFYKNWGTFWAGVIALAFPFFSEVIAFWGCFHSGLWYYSLAVGAWLAALGSFLLASGCSFLAWRRKALLIAAASADRCTPRIS